MKRNNKTRAFTLAEVMLAIGIMGIGMVFAACLFPAAIKEGEKSSNAIEGSIVAQNSLGLAQIRLTESALYNTSAFTRNVDPNDQIEDYFIWIDKETKSTNTASIGYGEPLLGNQLIYPLNKDPVGNSNEQPPFIESVIIIQPRNPTTADDNDYMMAAVSCRKTEWNSHIVAESIPVSYTKGDKTFTVTGNQDRFQVNGIVLYTNNINSLVTAKIVSIDGDTVTVNHELQKADDNVTEGTYVIVVYERDSSNNIVPTTPVMSVALTRSPLNE